MEDCGEHCGLATLLPPAICSEAGQRGRAVPPASARHARQGVAPRCGRDSEAGSADRASDADRRNAFIDAVMS